MHDGFLFRSLPAFTGCLAFLPACAPNDAPVDTDASSESSSGTSPTDTTLTTSPDDTSEGSSSEATSITTDPSETGEPTCGSDAMCGSEPPEGWFGPTIIARSTAGEEPPACPEEFPVAGPTVLEGFLNAEPVVCGCECEPPISASCYSSVRTSDNMNCYGYYYYGEYGYGYGGGGYYQVDQVCTNIDIDAYARFSSFGGGYGYGYGDMCTAVESMQIPPVSWESAISTCRLPETPLSCNDGSICIPPPAEGFEATWCLYQQGDSGCPAGIFNTKQVFHQGVVDTRGCSDCSCGSVGTNCQEAELMLFAAPDCEGEPDTLMPATNQCEPAQAQSVAVLYNGGDETCPVSSPPHATGTAEPTGEFTFCCTG